MNSSKPTLASIAEKIRHNSPLCPAEVALYTGVGSKTVTQDWIKRGGLAASKLGSRTLLIEPNALRVWLIDKRVKICISKIKKQSKEFPASTESPLTADSNIPQNGNLSSEKEEGICSDST